MKELVSRPHGDTLKESTIDTYHCRHAQVVMPITMATMTQPITPAMMMMMMHNISHASVGVAMVVMTVAAIQ